MIDIEDLLREEFRTRAAAADAAAADQPAMLARDLDRRIRRSRLRRRWTASALSAAAVAAAVAVPMALLSPDAGNLSLPGPRTAVPLTDTAATPPGWAPVAYGDAQISVPRDWRVSNRIVCGRAAPGYLVLGGASTSLRVRNPRCRQPAGVAAILAMPGSSAPGRPGRREVINGIHVTRLPSAGGFTSYLVPQLGVRVTARGPLASRVLATLTRSPLTVVLASGPASPVPAGWRWHAFGGIRFAAPASWRLGLSSTWGGCFGAFSMDPMTVTLSTARRMLALRCPATPDVVPLMPVRQGVIVGAGRMATLDSSRFDGCRRLHGLRACYSASIRNEGLLDVAVFVPGQHRPTIVEIGLAGTGATARIVFDSLQPAE